LNRWICIQERCPFDYKFYQIHSIKEITDNGNVKKVYGISIRSLQLANDPLSDFWVGISQIRINVAMMVVVLVLIATP
jgi:hypothetical protein